MHLLLDRILFRQIQNQRAAQVGQVAVQTRRTICGDKQQGRVLLGITLGILDRDTCLADSAQTVDPLFGRDGSDMGRFVDQNTAKLFQEFFAAREKRADKRQVLGFGEGRFNIDLVKQFSHLLRVAEFVVKFVASGAGGRRPSFIAFHQALAMETLELCLFVGLRELVVACIVFTGDEAEHLTLEFFPQFVFQLGVRSAQLAIGSMAGFETVVQAGEMDHRIARGHLVAQHLHDGVVVGLDGELVLNHGFVTA